jgi:hypothetical protein
MENLKYPHLKALCIEEWTCSLLSIHLLLVQFSLVSCAYLASKVPQYEYLQTFCSQVYCSSGVVETFEFFEVSLLIACYKYNEFWKLNMKQVWNILYVLKNYSVVGQETYWAKPVVNSYY